MEYWSIGFYQSITPALQFATRYWKASRLNSSEECLNGQ